MLKYFKEALSETQNASVDEIIAVEHRVISHVVLVCNDADFPEDLRLEIMGEIAVNSIQPFKDDESRNSNAVQYVDEEHSSLLIPKLSEWFQKLEKRKVTTRFGLLCGNPDEILISRTIWEEKEYGEKD
jgi:hypothetical protein